LPENQPDAWYEDRTKFDTAWNRYGRRDIFTSGDDPINYYSGNNYYGSDLPYGLPDGMTFKFKLIVLDVCNGDKTIYTSPILTDIF